MKRSRTDGYGVTTALVSSLLLVAACWSDVPGPAGPRPPAPIDPHALLIWRDSATTGQLRPVFDDSSVYFHSLDPEYHRTSSVNKATGTLRWKVTIPVTNPQTAGLGLQLVSGVLVVGDRDMFGVSPATGALLWRYVPSIGKNPGFAHQTTDGTTVFCGSTTGHVYAVDGRTGTERWATSIARGVGAIGVYDPVLVDGVVYVAYTDFSVSARGTTGVAALDAATGVVFWITKLPDESAANPSGSQGGIAVAGDFVVAPAGDRSVYALVRTTGAIHVKMPVAIFQEPTPIDNGRENRSLTSLGTTVFLTSGSGYLAAIDARDLHRVWRVNMNLGFPNDIAVDSLYVYVAHLGGQLSAFRVTDGSHVWTLNHHTFLQGDAELILAAPALDGDRVYAGGTYAVYALKRH